MRSCRPHRSRTRGERGPRALHAADAYVIRRFGRRSAVGGRPCTCARYSPEARAQRIAYGGRICAGPRGAVVDWQPGLGERPRRIRVDMSDSGRAIVRTALSIDPTRARDLRALRVGGALARDDGAHSVETGKLGRREEAGDRVENLRTAQRRLALRHSGRRKRASSGRARRRRRR